MTTLTVSNIRIHNSDDYIDAYVYIDAVERGEWRFGVSLDRERGTIYDSGYQWAENTQESFDDTGDDVPEDVAQAFAAIRPDMVAMLESAK